jgi:hypothetical protein
VKSGAAVQYRTAAPGCRCAQSGLRATHLTRGSSFGFFAMRKHLSDDLKRIRSRTKEFQSLAGDPWIKANSEIEPQRLHALGVIAFRWNLSEQKLLQLFAALLDCPEVEYIALAHELNDSALMVRVRAIAASRLKDDSKLLDAISNALEVFEVCRQNRNQFVHFYIVPAFGREKDGYMPAWDFERKERNPYAFTRVPFPNTVKDLRRVAKDIARLNLNLLAISLLVDRKYHPERGWHAPPLPKKLAVPEFLWKPPRPSRKERMSPPGSSPA